MMFAASVLVASFGYLLASATPVYAADATWEGDAVVYEGESYDPVDVSAANGLDGIPDGAQVYQYTGNLPAPVRIAKLIYFDSGAVPKSAKEATYITYTLNPPNDYSNPSATKTITLTPAPSPESTSEGQTSCAVDNVGWLVCGLGGWIAEAVDGTYRFLSMFLIVEPVVGGDNSMYRLWEVMRNIANLAFIIGFLVVIYSYLVGGGFSNYDIKKIVPRLVLAAILINVSYWICAVAVDISNIAGASLQDLFIAIRETAVGSEKNLEVSWEEMAAYILSGGAIATVAFLGIAGGSVGYLAFMLIGVLITVAFALFVALIIMAARQAIIIVLVVLAPIAFAAYVLPNTEKYFEKWRSIFFTMLLLFPIFSLLFGGSQLASAVIVQNADNMAVMLFGMAIQIIPLIITPLLIQFSGGLIGRIAGVVNSSQKGLFDRSKGWTQKQADYQKDRNLARENNRWNRLNVARRGGQAMSRMGKNQDDRQKNYQTRAENMRHRTRAYDKIDTEQRDADLDHKTIEAGHDKHWKDRMNRNDTHYDAGLARRQMNLINLEEGAKESDSAFTAAAAEARTYRRILATDSADDIAKKQEHNNKLMADGFTEDQLKIATVTAQSLAIEGLRLKRAEEVSQAQMARIFRDNVKIRDTDTVGAQKLAGGIDPNGGAKVYARATKDITDQLMENVTAQKSVFSNEGYDLNELFKVFQQKELRDGSTASEEQIYAAMQQVGLDKGNNWSVQKLVEFVGTQGMRQDRESGRIYAKDAAGVEIDITDNAAEQDSRRDMQQILADIVANSKLKVDYLSGTDRGALQTGNYTWDSHGAILRDIKEEKISPQRLANADYDVLQRMIQVMRTVDADPQALQNVTEHRDVLISAIDEALTNENLKGLSGPREKKVMESLRLYLEDPTHQTSSKQDKEATLAKVIAPVYDITRPHDPLS